MEEEILRCAQNDMVEGADGGPGDPAATGRLAAEKKRLRRRLRLSGAVIDRLAREYGPPYDSYGKLRAYIDAYDRLPPRRCLKKAHPHAVDPYAWKELAAGNPQPKHGGSRWKEFEALFDFE